MKEDSCPTLTSLWVFLVPCLQWSPLHWWQYPLQKLFSGEGWGWSSGFWMKPAKGFAAYTLQVSLVVYLQYNMLMRAMKREQFIMPK